MTDNIICCWCGEVITDPKGYYEDGIAMHPECEAEANAEMKTGKLT